MKLKEIQNIFHKELDSLFGANEVTSFFDILLNHYLSLNRITLILEPNYTVTKEEEHPLFEALSRLKKEEPIQYILGETEFFGLPFKVNKSTLIPRPETEELVSAIIKTINSCTNTKPLKILDIGTGSGCIAISLAKNLPNAQVYALDVSESALKVAKENALRNDVTVTFIQKDILDSNLIENASIPSEFDIIVSNPPYVRELEKEIIKNNVLNFEPHLALFVPDNNPLKFYKAISEFAINNLEKKGFMFFEINQYLGEQMKELLEDNGFINIELIKDIFGKDRMIKVIKN